MHLQTLSLYRVHTRSLSNEDLSNLEWENLRHLNITVFYDIPLISVYSSKIYSDYMSPGR